MSRLIDADYVMKALGIFNNKQNGNEHFLNGIETAREIVQDAPTIEAEPVRHGHWVNRGKDLEAHSMEVFDAWSCSRCRYYIHGNGYPKWKYCPMCGCRMKEADQ